MWHGGNNIEFIAVWFFIALWTLVDPAFHQRCYAAKRWQTAQIGILVSIIFWFIFDFMTSAAGLYARASLPQLKEPMYSYPLLAEVTLPVVAKGMFYIGMLATIMSTLSSLTLISAITVGKDIVGRWKNASSDSDIVQRWTKVGLVISALFSIILGNYCAFCSKHLVHDRHMYYPRIIGTGASLLFRPIKDICIVCIRSYVERLVHFYGKSSIRSSLRAQRQTRVLVRS